MADQKPHEGHLMSADLAATGDALKAKLAKQYREDREYQQYGRYLAERLILIGRGHKYRIRKYRRKNAVLGWLVQQEQVRQWLGRWHIKPGWVIGMTTTIHRRDGKVMNVLTTITCYERDYGSCEPKEWNVVVPEPMPEMVYRIPEVLA
jgi:hypothetical protein